MNKNKKATTILYVAFLFKIIKLYLSPNINQMETFKQFKKKIITNCKRNGALTRDLDKIKNTSNYYDLWLWIFSNYRWCKLRRIFEESEKPLTFVFPEKYDGSLNFRECDLKGVTLPIKLNGDLDLSCCNLTEIIFPQEINGLLILDYCLIPSNKLKFIQEKYTNVSLVKIDSYNVFEI